MGRISIFLLLFLSVNAHAQPEAWQDRGDGKQSVFFQLIPEFVSLNVDHVLHRFDNDRDITVRTGIMANLTYWLGVPLEINYTIPIGTAYNHLDIGCMIAYTWNSTSNPSELFGGPRLGFRRQKNSMGLFYRFGIAYTWNQYKEQGAVETTFKIKPAIAVGYSF